MLISCSKAKRPSIIKFMARFLKMKGPAVELGKIFRMGSDTPAGRDPWRRYKRAGISAQSG